MTHVPHETVSLAAGAMPLLGFGTWQITGPDAVTATSTALEAGYRHLDTATVYDNEAEVGRALAESGVPREDVFLTTKCPPERIGREQETLENSLEKLRTDYLDLWLIHWTVDSADDRRRVWESFIAAQEEGLVRDIGVSNYSPAQIDELVRATGVTPVVNQIKWSPLLCDASLARELADRDVVLEGYSALRGGTLTNETICEIAEQHGRTPAQVIIRWHLQHEFVVIPKSSNPERIASNADVADFELSDAEMTRLDKLGSGRE
jgi:diketogulonate reductase-like aldo/keto reductase